ncbi:efflux RND transporter periplasmic adaptor subunit [Flexithrix dorotheae]|uniref:efflux RND transporter periplasmic adaptor subunit n=1 Tax=Flexithrix dorotheae TaxID=70993 RepID=UPI00037FB364|nr:efflux RND transporter periplasmic adaptor subunit [Flexithrix dorotheae]
MNKALKNLVFATIASTIFSCSSEQKPSSNTSDLTVEVYKVKKQTFSNEIVTTANLLAQEQVNLMAPIAGQVLDIYFKEGQKVNKGQTIIRLDDRTWKAELVGINAELTSAQKDYDRKKELLSFEGSSQEEVDLALAKVLSLQSKQQQLQVNINLANVTAPFFGQLGLRNFSEGAFLRQGDLITSLTANQQLKVDFSIAQAYKKSIKINKKITVLVEGDSLTATIYAISPAVDEQTRMITVRAMLKQNPKNNILPGTFAEIILPTNAIDDALLVPTEAVVPSITEQTVYVYNNGKAERRVVTLGNRTADKVHILTGLKEGDSVLTTGLLTVKDGMSISLKHPIQE